MTPAERFAQYVDKSGDCWEWSGGRQSKGYGHFWNGSKNVRAHRFAWEQANRRPIPEGLICLHTCDNPPCVNPDHLMVGTYWMNTMDMRMKDRGSHRPIDRREARFLYMLGWTQKRIAERLHVSANAVSQAVRW